MSSVFNSQVEDLNEIFQEIEKKNESTKLIREATEIVYFLTITF